MYVHNIYIYNDIYNYHIPIIHLIQDFPNELSLSAGCQDSALVPALQSAQLHAESQLDTWRSQLRAEPGPARLLGTAGTGRTGRKWQTVEVS